MTENAPDTNVGNIKYIRKQDALDAFGLSEKTRKYGGDHSGYDTRMLYEIQDTIESLEPADVAPVRHGKWLPIVSYNNTYKCSECGRLLVDITDGLKMVDKHYPYCHCGAKMDEEE